MRIFIIIPAFNEEKNIIAVIQNLKNRIPFAELVVVDDCSQDSTFQFVKKTDVAVLRHIVNRGQGAALQTGNEYALKNGADIIVHFDADGQHRVEDLEKIIKPIKDGETDITLGSRFLNISSKIPFTKKYFILKPAVIFNRLFTGLKLTDAHNGLRAFSLEAAGKIKITQDRMAHATEIISEIKKSGLKYQEVPIKIIYNKYGQKFTDGFCIVKDLIFRKIL
ncbi:MAG: glycosyltransferase family 2 protein [Patescibacteria group bacterium]|nr:glycosyltransferase family 2 protein [Patescibacteria group bacterium]